MITWEEAAGIFSLADTQTLGVSVNPKDSDVIMSVLSHQSGKLIPYGGDPVHEDTVMTETGKGQTLNVDTKFKKLLLCEITVHC